LQGFNRSVQPVALGDQHGENLFSHYRDSNIRIADLTIHKACLVAKGT
jgi:hypothetical protein